MSAMTHLSKELERGFIPIAEGVSMRDLRVHEGGGRTFLIRMRRGARAPFHLHPGGEETFLLAGRLRITHRVDQDRAPLPDLVLEEGAYGYVPPGEQHDGIAEEDALFLVVAPGGVAPTPRRP